MFKIGKKDAEIKTEQSAGDQLINDMEMTSNAYQEMLRKNKQLLSQVVVNILEWQ